MFSHIFKSVFCSLLSKVTKRGFTLAEALIITVMTGACLLPILGTMQNAQVRTENYDHQSKMQQYARSRLTAEIANAAFDHKSINLEDEYHYIVYFAPGTPGNEGSEDDAKLIELPKTYATLEDMASLTADTNGNWATAAIDLLGIQRADKKPYLQVVHAYKTSVESKNNPALAEYGNDSNVIDSPKALLGIVVKTCLIKSNDNFYDPADGALITSFNTDGSINTTDKDSSVLPVTLFSFVNLPTVSDEYIWMVASDSKVIAFDPFSKTIANTIVFGKGEQEPCHIAVHPSGKMLAVQCHKYIYLVNIDVKSPNKNEKKELYHHSSLELKEGYCEGPEYSGGIVFRTDGKVLYFTDVANKKLHMCELNYSLSNNQDRVLDWNNLTPSVGNSKSIDSNNKKFTNLVAASDGYLYVGACLTSGEGDLKSVYKYPMYTGLNEGSVSQIVKTENEIRNIDVSSDGRFLLCIPKLEDNGCAMIYETNTGKLLDNKTINTDKKVMKGIFVSFSGNKLDFKDNSLFIALSLKEKGDNKPAYIGIYNFLDTTNLWAKLAIDTLTETEYLMSLPIDGEIVFPAVLGNGEGNKERLLYFANYLFKNENYELKLDESVYFGKKNALDLKKAELAAKKRDILAVAEGEATKTIQLYDLNTLKILEDNVYTATYTTTGLAMNSQGSMILSSHNEYGPNTYQYNILDGSTKKPNIGSYTKKVVFDGASLDMAFALQNERDSGGSITSQYFYNLYSDFLANRWETSSSDYYDRRNFKIPSGWNGLDIIGMPNGGAMALYGKSDGSSMLEWIGRTNWDDSVNKGKYKLFARWTNVNVSHSGNTYPSYLKSLNSFTNQSDGYSGMLVIDIDHSIPDLGSRIKSLNIYASSLTHPNDPGGAVSWGNEVAFVTPLILSKNSDGTFKVFDYAESIPINCGKLYNDVEVNWIKNDGRISAGCHFGFWGGRYKDGISMKSRLGIAFETKSSGYNFVSDIFTDSSTTNFDAHRTFDNFETILNSTTLQPINNYATSNSYTGGFCRDYAIQFNTEPIPSSCTFPPLYSKKLAISPDCGTLAILVDDPTPKRILNIFDFNNFIYGPETQVEGLLVDYRANGRGGTEWPYEKDNVFKNVINGISFKDSTMPTFASATTKFESWQSFRAYPANYGIDYHIPDGDEHEVNKTKEQANKRFFGYFRPESDINFMQSYGSEDIRFFLNKHYIAGRKDSSSLFTLPISFSVKAFESGLFQKDEAFNNSTNGTSNIFIAYNNSNLANVDSDTSLERPDTTNPATNYYKIAAGKSFDYMNSCNTYILKNQPSFINSYPVQTNDGDYINMNYANMIFSKDRAKPTLYIKGENKLFVLYKNIFKMFAPGTGNNSKNITISDDGQKLVFGKSNSLRVYNISNPSDEFFENGGNINGPANNYLGQIATISTSIKPLYLAAKPYSSYSSSKIGGEYRLMVTDNLKITANSAAVASGGIYIVKSNSNGIAVYNPLKNPTSVLSDGNIRNNTKSAAVAVYDDKLYLFGNILSSIRIQNYDVNTKEALQSYVVPPVYNDQYWANVVALHKYNPLSGGYHSDENGWGNAISIESGNNAPGWPGIDDDNWITSENAFDGKTNSGWRTSSLLSNSTSDEAKQYVKYTVNYSSGLIVNSIYINNKYASNKDYGVTYFELYGINDGCAPILLKSGTLNKDDERTINFENQTSYKEFKFVCKNSTQGKGRGVAEIKLMRRGLKRLTPSNSVTENNKLSFSWTNADSNYCTIKTSDITADNFRVAHFYPNNYTNDYYNNQSYTDTPEGWQSSCTDTVKPYILFSCSKKEILKVLRYTNTSFSKSYIKKFRIYGSNNTSVSPNPSDSGSNWQLLSNLQGNGVFTNCPPTSRTWITYEINNDVPYNNYLFWIEEVESGGDNLVRLTGFELYGENYNEPENSLSPLKTDNLVEITTSDSAACSTPYGLVISGGLNGSNATSTTLLYWPHSVNLFDGKEYCYGITRSLPEMKNSRANHVLVWHKGKIYAIGGREKTGDNDILDKSHFIEVLDYNKKLEWKEYSIPYKFVDEASEESINKRYNHGACSFGDEIFIFGGVSSSSNIRSSAIAFNPETGTIRNLTDMEDVLGSDKRLNPCVAVPFGSKIYIIGNDKDNTSTLKILEYTP